MLNIKNFTVFIVSNLLIMFVIFINVPLSLSNTDITSNQIYTSDQNWVDTVSITGVTVTFNGGNGFFNQNLNIRGATLNINSPNTITIGGNFDIQGDGAVLNMASGSSITISGNLNKVSQGTLNFQNLSVGSGTSNFAQFTGGIINFTDNVIINGEASFEYGTEAYLAAGKTFTATTYAEVQDATGRSASFQMDAGSTFNAGKTSNGALWVGFDDNKSTAPAYFRIVGGNNTISSPATINVGIGLEIGDLGQLIVENNSTLNININDGPGSTYGQGFLHLGGYQTGDLLDLKNPTTNQPFTADWTGGTLKIGSQSIVNVNQRLYLGEKGIIDIEPQGKLNVAGDFYFKRDSIYKVGVDNTGISLITVAGTAYIENGAIVELPINIYNKENVPFFTASNYANNNYPYSILYQIEKNGNSLVISGSKTQEAIQDDILKIAQSGGHGQNQNSLNSASLIARTLVLGNIPSNLKNSLNQYITQALDDAQNGYSRADLALKQIIGEEGVNAVNISIDTIYQITYVLGNRFVNLHSNYLNPPSSGSQDNLNRIWVTAMGSWIKQKNLDGFYGYDYNLGGIVLGYDRELENVPGLTLGINGAWSSGKLKINDGLSDIKIKTVSIGAYSSYKLKNGIFIDGNISFGFIDNDFDANQVYGGHKTANFKGNSFQASLDLGKVFTLSDSIFFQPSVGLNYVHLRQKSWSEKISSNPNNLVIANWYDNSSFDYLEIPVNLKLYGTFQSASGILLTPSFKVGGVFMANKPNREMRVGFVGSNDSASIRGIDSGKHRFTVGTDLKVQFTNSVDFFVRYDLETRKSYTAHSGQLGLGISF
ncbi:MAG: autotransporter outer membrane beta-barrel domain-containing protein [Bifidobacteriaceae bacterium]|jgi:outer membrane autotransporter protein|nr:autotransporter outer membrane beta-barrel domain-containing protein [Bifidobacteriaceae bacterium]